MADDLLLTLEPFSSLSKIVKNQLECWPDHYGFLSDRFVGNDKLFLQRCDSVANLALKLIDNEIGEYCESYKWTCLNFVAEQKHFVRYGQYRLTTFEEAREQVYDNDEYMSRYLRGILMSQIFWDNHARAIDWFREQFLVSCRSGGDYLEVGPGHGLYAYFAAQADRFSTLTGWEYSAAGVAATKAALEKLGVKRGLDLVRQDVLESDPHGGAFDVAVISEVLEHLERPQVALRTLYRCLRPGGRLFVNVPINSPAPDHIFLWRNQQEVLDLLSHAGFKTLEAEYFPVTGYPLDQALKRRLTVNCVFIAERI